MRIQSHCISSWCNGHSFATFSFSLCIYFTRTRSRHELYTVNMAPNFSLVSRKALVTRRLKLGSEPLLDFTFRIYGGIWSAFECIFIWMRIALAHKVSPAVEFDCSAPHRKPNKSQYLNTLAVEAYGCGTVVVVSWLTKSCEILVSAIRMRFYLHLDGCYFLDYGMEKERFYSSKDSRWKCTLYWV